MELIVSWQGQQPYLINASTKRGHHIEEFWGRHGLGNISRKSCKSYISHKNRCLPRPPGCPRGPVGPVGPTGPCGAPFKTLPLSPVGPFGPGGPVSPLKPGGPGGPGLLSSPLPPGSPRLPGLPLLPFGPGNPGGPGGPGGHCNFANYNEVKARWSPCHPICILPHASCVSFPVSPNCEIVLKYNALSTLAAHRNSNRYMHVAKRHKILPYVISNSRYSMWSSYGPILVHSLHSGYIPHTFEVGKEEQKGENNLEVWEF